MNEQAPPWHSREPEHSESESQSNCPWLQPLPQVSLAWQKSSWPFPMHSPSQQTVEPEQLWVAQPQQPFRSSVQYFRVPELWHSSSPWSHWSLQAGSTIKEPVLESKLPLQLEFLTVQSRSHSPSVDKLNDGKETALYWL